jgi:hypothetical protein
MRHPWAQPELPVEKPNIAEYKKRRADGAKDPEQPSDPCLFDTHSTVNIFETEPAGTCLCTVTRPPR